MAKTETKVKRGAVSKENPEPKGEVLRVSKTAAGMVKQYAKSEEMAATDAADYLIRFAMSRKQSLADHRKKQVAESSEWKGGKKAKSEPKAAKPKTEKKAKVAKPKSKTASHKAAPNGVANAPAPEPVQAKTEDAATS